MSRRKGKVDQNAAMIRGGAVLVSVIALVAAAAGAVWLAFKGAPESGGE